MSSYYLVKNTEWYMETGVHPSLVYDNDTYIYKGTLIQIVKKLDEYLYVMEVTDSINIIVMDVKYLKGELQ